MNYDLLPKLKTPLAAKLPRWGKEEGFEVEVTN